MTINRIRLTAHFFLNEFECPCCKTVRITAELVARLESLRRAWGKPIKINSGYRCKRHNSEVGGTQYSKHMEGRAVDVPIPYMDMDSFAELAHKAGFRQVIPYPDRQFFHLGV